MRQIERACVTHAATKIYQAGGSRARAARSSPKIIACSAPPGRPPPHAASRIAMARRIYCRRAFCYAEITESKGQAHVLVELLSPFASRGTVNQPELRLAPSISLRNATAHCTRFEAIVGRTRCLRHIRPSCACAGTEYRLGRRCVAGSPMWVKRAAAHTQVVQHEASRCHTLRK